MSKCFYHIIGVAVLVLAFSSCSSTKTLKKPHSIEGMTEREYVENVVTNAGGWDALTGKMTLAVDLGEKGVTKVNGMLRIKRNKVIQMSITPLLGIEVARIEISPDGVLVIDRMNKRYVKASFAEVMALASADLNFHTLQSLFMNELFLPGKNGVTIRDFSAYHIDVDVANVMLGVKKQKRFSYRFHTQAPEALLKETHIGLIGTPYGLKWKYDDFRPLEHKRFPMEMYVSFIGGKKTLEASFKLSRLSTESNWDAHTELSRKYKQVELEDILKLLLK